MRARARRAPETTPPSAAVLGEDEVDRDGLRVASRRHRRRRAADYDAREPAEAREAAIEPVELDPEDRLALDAALQLGRRADGQDPAAVDDRDPLAQLIGLGHVVGREQHRPTGHRRAPVEDELADPARRRDVQAQRRLVEEQDPWVVQQPAGDVHLLALAGGQRATPSGARCSLSPTASMSSSTRFQPSRDAQP